ncbi:MAG TPA: hypothetical protein VFX92_00615 [Candidatus Krumholzibacteria bacterium]|nr:hypothetical protein [Candidatus Krumholzibacteria bacterium]
MVRVLALLLLLSLACTAPGEPTPLAPGCFAFGVFGDGPYRSWEVARFRRVLADVNRSDIAWLVHVGDIFSYPCSDRHYQELRATMNAVQHPVVYTPGDNEWADCHGRLHGGYAPLERLAELRRTFFAQPGTTLGALPMRVVAQAAEPGFSEFVENVRWTRGGFVFATVDMVGSDNATEPFRGRTAADDSAVVRRTAAAIAWMDEAFEVAAADGASGVVLAMHGDPGFRTGRARPGFGGFVSRLRRHAADFDGPVLLVHGDSHIYRVDHPLRRFDREAPMESFTRLCTMGSPDIGWVRVVVDSVAGQVVSFEPRRVPWWRLW